MTYQRFFAPYVVPPCASSVQVFALPELLPASVRLLLDLRNSAAIVLQVKQGTEIISCGDSFHLTPSSARVFFSLLQAYPTCCSYRSLFALLYPLPQEQEAGRWWHKDGP